MLHSLRRLASSTGRPALDAEVEHALDHAADSPRPLLFFHTLAIVRPSSSSRSTAAGLSIRTGVFCAVSSVLTHPC